MTTDRPLTGSTALDQGDPASPDPRRWLILAVIGIAQLMVVLDATIVNIALPSAQQALGFSISDRQWVVTAYSLAFGGLLLVGGRLSDLIGRKRTFIIGLTGFAAASAVGGAAHSFGALIGARAVQGAFGALLAPSALALLTTTFTDARERGKALGIFTTVAGAGGALGLLLGGVLTESLSWRWCLYVNIAFAAVALAGALVLLSNQQRSRDGALDGPGSLVSIGGLVAIVYGFSQASTRGWEDPITLGLIAGGLLLLAAFVVIETRVARPLLPIAVLADRTRGGAYLSLVIGGMGVIGMFLLLTYYLQQTLDFSPVQTGLAFLPFILGIVVVSNVVSNVALERLGPKVIVPAGMFVAAAGALWLTHVGVHSGYVTDVAPALVLLGAGMGGILVPAFSLGPAGTDPADAGVASALVNTSNQIGGSLGAALLNTIAANATVGYLTTRRTTAQTAAAAAVHGDVVAFRLLIAILLAGAVITALIYPRRTRIAPPHPTGSRSIGR